MTMENRNVSDAIEQYLGSHAAGGMISMRAALRAVRCLAPQSKATDDELSAAIATHAIGHHHNISFDRGRRTEAPPGIPPRRPRRPSE